MLNKLQNVLRKNRTEIIRKWALLVSSSSPSYSTRPKHEIHSSCSWGFDGCMKMMFENHTLLINDYITSTVNRRAAAKFKVSEVQNALTLLRTAAMQHIIADIPKEELEEVLGLIDKQMCYLTQQFTEKFQQKHEMEILRMNQTLSSTLAELKIEKTNATTANILKDQFLANVSHELRTPLTSIIGFSKLMMSNGTDANNTKEKVKVIYEQGKNLLHLIDTLIMIAEINAGTRKQQKDRVNLEDLVKLVIGKIKKLADEKDVVLEVCTSKKTAMVIADSEQLSAALYELVANGIKFSPAGEKVIITCEVANDEVQISTKDSGIGMKKSDVGQIFTPFFQLDGSTTRQYGGSGLGLTMIQKVAEMHDGGIDVSTSPGKGSTFTLYFPFIKAG